MDMKHFYYTISKNTHRRMYGGYNQEARIYKLVKGAPVFLGTSQWCTASTCGETSEIMQSLIRAKLLPKKWLDYSRDDSTGAGYYRADNGKFLIHSL